MKRFRSPVVSFPLAAVLICSFAPSDVSAADPPSGFTALFNGKDLGGWWGLGHFDPRKVWEMKPEELAALKEKNAAEFAAHWTVENGELVNDGKGPYATSEREFRDFELQLDYKTVSRADSGIYLKANPQVQIWDYTDPAKFDRGADKGSGGLFNNAKDAPGRDPLVLADKAFGEWNHFRIIQLGSRTWVWLNEKLVVDGAIHENFWDRASPLFAKGPFQLQTHGGEIRWRNIFVREIGTDEANKLLRGKDPEGFARVFNGKDLDGWAGPVNEYEVRDEAVVCQKGKGGTIFTKAEYADFVARMEIKIPKSGNNGLAIRYPGQGDTAYVGMCELQVLDDSAPGYAKLDPRQYHGSAYGMTASHRGFQRPAGEWNYQEVTVKGSTIKVELNGTMILNTDLSKVTEYMANSPHPGKDRTSGHFGFAGHGSDVMFRNVSIKKL
jgi:hypothetical protein